MFVLDTHAGFKIRCFLKMCSNFTHRQNEDGFKGSCSENFVIFAEKYLRQEFTVKEFTV